jgi:kumamolisin
MASGAKVRVYATRDLAFVHLDQAYQAIINDLPSQPALHQISLSYGLGETYMPAGEMQTDDQYFAAMAAAGITVFVSSGDGGSSPGLNGYADNMGLVQVESPANDPNVTAVGGTSLTLN